MNNEFIYGYTLEKLGGWLEERGHKRTRALQVWDALYRKRVKAFSEMMEVNRECAELVSQHFVMETMEEHVRQESADGTMKFLFRLKDGNLIETVLMRQKYGLSVCVTTQVGCNIGCSFCASGLLAKSRDLSAAEIVEQIMKVQRHLDSVGQGQRVSHVVVMGIGEPFDNFANLLDFLSIVKEHKGLAIAAKGITVSTSGLAGKIREFADANTGVNLAVSLHAPNNELRTSIMKINKAIPLEKLMPAIDYYLEKTGRRITLEYILLKDINDGAEHALELSELIGERRPLVNVNLIPYNPVDEHSQYKRTDRETVSAFFDVLKKQGVSVSKRLEHGSDIDAACGQLRSKQIRRSGNAAAPLSNTAVL